MAISKNRNDPNADKFDFNAHARTLAASDPFGDRVDRRGLGLKTFVEGEVQRRASMFATSPTNTTLVPGKVYLRQLRDGTWELLVYRGRCTYDAYPGETAEELIAFAKENFIKES